MKGQKMFPYFIWIFIFNNVFVAGETSGLHIFREEVEVHPNLTGNGIKSAEDELIEINTEIGDDDGSNLLLYLGIGLLLTLEVIAGVVVSVYYIKGKRTAHPVKASPLTRKEIEEFLNGVKEIGRISQNSATNLTLAHSELGIETLPYDRSKEIILRDFKINTFSANSKGEFGTARKGTFINRGNPTNFNDYEKIPITVRTGSSKSNGDGLRSLMKEVKLMMHVGHHKRLVNMIGCCTGKLREGKLYMLLEHCEMGTLERYLHKHRTTSFGSIMMKEQILKWKKRKVPDEEDDTVEWDEEKIDNVQMIRWCTEIAEGMEFLNGKKVIHGDLSARNVLLGKGLHVKLADFGMCNWLYYYNQYIETNREPLPWRWLPIETLKNMEFTLFTVKSDVWMFGVTSWEIFTLGEKPYSELKWGREFIQNLDRGMRLRKPENSTSECYNTMMRCWEKDPRKRPSFSEILLILARQSSFRR